MRAALALLLALLSAFCIYGFVASGELGPNQIYFRIGYAIAAIVTGVGAWSLMRSSRQNSAK
jgi:hypothetical protein